MRTVLGTDFNNYRIRYYFEKLNIRPSIWIILLFIIS